MDALQPRDDVGKLRSTWPAEQAADLNQWWTVERSSAGVCAKLLNDKYQTTYTRSAVMGRVYRDQLPKHERQPAKRMPRKGWVSGRPRQTKQCAAKPKPYLEAVQIEDAAIPLTQRRAFAQLDRRMCKWPVGDPDKPDFFFCGGKSLESYSYCAGHCNRAFGYVRGR